MSARSANRTVRSSLDLARSPRERPPGGHWPRSRPSSPPPHGREWRARAPPRCRSCRRTPPRPGPVPARRPSRSPTAAERYRTRPGSRCTSTFGRSASVAATGIAWVSAVIRWFLGSIAASRMVDVPASKITAASAAGSNASAASAIRRFSSGWDSPAVGRPTSSTVNEFCRKRSPMHPAYQAQLLEGVEVAANGLGGDAELDREIGHRDPPAPG